TLYLPAFVMTVVCLVYYPRLLFGGGFYRSTNDRTAFIQENEGLPTDPRTSAVSGRVLTRDDRLSGVDELEMYIGFYENTSSGAKIYKRTFVVDVEETDNEIPPDFKLDQNYPNPFNPSTAIQFSIPEESFVKLEIFNSLGEKITTLVSEELNAGNYKYEWNAENLSSGIYFYRLNTNNFSEMKKMIFLK
ncbi:MAG TPA: T9SS type A sorting domain-containing protein, partial [Ignavibacteriaceae bacterium]